jgi:hypothetical protein
MVKHPVKGCFFVLFSKESLKGKIIQMMIVLLLNTESESSQILNRYLKVSICLKRVVYSSNV